MERPARVTVAGLLVVLAALALFLTARFLDDPPTVTSDGAAHSDTKGPASASDRAPDHPNGPDGKNGPPTSEEFAAPSRAAEPEERDGIGAIETEGRVLLFGVVTGFDDAPCPGAQIFHQGQHVGTSDAQGGYRVEVGQNTWNPMSATRWSNFLAAVKVGVGSVAVECSGASRRIDLKLECKTLFSGRCIQRHSRAPVPGAALELLSVQPRETVPLFALTTTCDEKGAFRFVGVAPQMVELRARADGFASDGWFPFDVTNGKDRTNVEFELERIAHARGWFVPWPPPRLAGPAAASARVVATQGAGRDRGPEVEPIVAAVAADGTFDVPFATCNGIDFLLEAGGGALWREHLRPDFDGGDVDFGKITLADPCALTGRVNVPRDVLELGLDFLVVAQLETGPREFRFPVGLDGSFRAEPLPPGRMVWSVMLGERLVTSEAERDRSLGDWQEPAPGSQRDLGVIEPGGRVVVGRVTLASGASAAGAMLQLPIPFRKEDGKWSFSFRNGDGECDARGRFVMKISRDDERDDDPWNIALASPVRLFARRRDEVGHSALFRFPPSGEAARCDLVLGPGKALRGRLVDARGSPLADQQLSLMPAPGDVATAFWFDHLSATTGDDGEFELLGLEDADYVARILVDGSYVDLGRVHPGGAAVTLTLRPGG